MSIPWQAQYQASAYAECYGIVPSLLTQFPGYNLDDPLQLHPSGGIPLPMHRNPSGSLRIKRASFTRASLPTVGQWFPHVEEGTINVLARSSGDASDSARRPPLTLCARFSGKGDRSQLVVVDVDADASVRALKKALLRAAGRPVHRHLMDALTVWRVDMTDGELQAIDQRNGLAGGQRPRPCSSFSTPLLMADGAGAGARVGDFFGPAVNISRANPGHVSLSVYIHQGAEHELAPAVHAPRFTYPMPADALAPRRAERSLGPMRPTQPPTISTEDGAEVAVQVALDTPSPAPSRSSGGSGDTVLAHAPLRCCATKSADHVIGLGIFMSPVPSSESDHASGSEDDELPSWPPTPNVGDDLYGWSAKDSWKHNFAFPQSAFPSSQPGFFHGNAKLARSGSSRRPTALQSLFVPPSPLS